MKYMKKLLSAAADTKLYLRTGADACFAMHPRIKNRRRQRHRGISDRDNADDVHSGGSGTACSLELA